MVIPAAVLKLNGFAILAIAVVGFLLAWGLNVLVEDPLRRGRVLATTRRSLTAALAGSVVLIVISLTAIVLVGTVRLDAGRPSSTATFAPPDATASPSPPQFSDYVPSDLTPSLDTVAQDVPIIYADHCHADTPVVEAQRCSFGDLASTTVIALFGDSHAAQWFPALEQIAEDDGYRLDVYTKSSCPSVDVPILVHGVPYPECDAWRASVIQRLAATPPALTVISNMSDQPDQGPTGIAVSAWQAGLEKVLGQIGGRALVIADTPRFPETPAVCLSAHLDDALACSSPRSVAVRANWVAADRAAAASSGAAFIDLTDYLCDPTSCGAIVGRTLLYRDDNHLTATAAAGLAAPLGAAVQRALAGS